jgi:hypothetical protein
MIPMNLVRLSAALPFLSLISDHPFTALAPTTVKLSVATLHAAALTAPRAPTDSVDAPYFLVSVAGPKSSSATIRLPALGHLSIHQDEALGARPLADLHLEAGDSVRLLVSVLEGKKVQADEEAAAAAASTAALLKPAEARASIVSSALKPVLANGAAHWLGSATLLLTNEGGTTYWRELECVATCKVLSGAGAAAVASGKGAAGVVELSGSGATYHMQLQGQRAP